ncbi:putative colanic acid biosynthesis acetyltransferase [Brevundimonas staleyi]|uniref:Colanic acid biosynthesis acetyltransferase n=1 Tax=Brevundimonas staleyi TaxID=74326 RepID=A0ABW0FVU6_9CAUL
MSAPMDAARTNPIEGGASYKLSHRLFRLAWNVVWALLASWTPPFMRGWRRWLLRRFGATIDDTAGVYGSAQIWYPPNLTMGAHAYIGPGAIVYCMAPITLDDYAIVSQRAHLCAGTHNIDDPNFQLEVRPIRIGRRGWVAAEAFVGPGVTIGEGAVLGGRAVAFRDLKPWGVYSGNPAGWLRERRVRFSEQED